MIVRGGVDLSCTFHGEFLRVVLLLKDSSIFYLFF